MLCAGRPMLAKMKASKKRQANKKNQCKANNIYLVLCRTTHSGSVCVCVCVCVCVPHRFWSSAMLQGLEH